MIFCIQKKLLSWWEGLIKERKEKIIYLNKMKFMSIASDLENHIKNNLFISNDSTANTDSIATNIASKAITNTDSITTPITSYNSIILVCCFAIRLF